MGQAHEELLIRAIRFTVATEFEATQINMQLAGLTNNKLAVQVLMFVADEEHVHVGEFLRLLRELAPDEEKFYANGAKEVEAEIKKYEVKDSCKTAQQSLSSEVLALLELVYSSEARVSSRHPPIIRRPI